MQPNTQSIIIQNGQPVLVPMASSFHPNQGVPVQMYQPVGVMPGSAQYYGGVQPEQQMILLGQQSLQDGNPMLAPMTSSYHQGTAPPMTSSYQLNQSAPHPMFQPMVMVPVNNQFYGGVQPIQQMALQGQQQSLYQQQTINLAQGNSQINQQENMDPVKQEDSFEDKNIEYLQRIWQATEVQKFYKFLFVWKILMQIFFFIYLFFSAIFYFLRPKYSVQEVGGKKYFIATTKPVSDSGYECTPVANADMLDIINMGDGWIVLALILIMPYKIFFIKRQIGLFRSINKGGYVTKSQKFDIYYLDYINIFFDYTFIIFLSPITAVVYEHCANLRYGFNSINPTVIYVLGVIFALFNFFCLSVLLTCCKSEKLDMILIYPFIIMCALPGALIVLCVSIGLSILSIPTTETTVTTYYSDGSTTTSKHTNEGEKLFCAGVFFCFALLVAAYFVLVLLISFALLFAFCHPAVILYYTTSITIAFISIYMNKGGANYLQQYKSYLAYLSIYETQRFSEAFPMIKKNPSDFKTEKNNKKYIECVQDASTYRYNEQNALKQLTVRTTVRKINNYNQFVEGVVEVYYEEQVNKNKPPPPITEAAVLPFQQTQS